ncbi:hypothetical protein F8388_023191 [Cannabis sativa]|uniref:Retrotransposon Copia-like N-terminal domain-containing protein n=1 Tax=Cannabis sativa TaxID=3483 RepID=A0A7J6HN04_CANSA|nr:hypothetical protein F8388_023191 [Cannabis sativa]KAF4396654.1 hypothetical protein G4B88_028968 [Cannabis sativa]
MDPRHPEPTAQTAAPTSATATAATPVLQPVQQWNPFQNSLNSSLTVRLDRTNFLAWKFQVIPTVIGHGLDDILLTGIAHVRVLVNGGPNPEFTIWKRKDQLLLSWLRSSMTETILSSLAQVVSMVTMAEGKQNK